jgi:hypothetical protein
MASCEASKGATECVWQMGLSRAAVCGGGNETLSPPQQVLRTGQVFPASATRDTLVGGMAPLVETRPGAHLPSIVKAEVSHGTSTFLLFCFYLGVVES